MLRDLFEQGLGIIMETKLYIIGCGIGEKSMSHSALNIIAKADIIAGGRRLLADFAHENSEQIIIGTDVPETVRRLIAESADKLVVILASGDALFHGIAGTDRKSTRLNSSHTDISRMPSSA